MQRRAVLVIAGLVFCAMAADAGAQTWNSYAVKFVCGNVVRGPFEDAVDGKYKTTVNIHNPHYLLDVTGAPRPVQFFKKIVLAPHQDELPLPPSCWLEELLDGDHALSVNCGNISQQLALSGLPSTAPLDGYVVLLVPPNQDQSGSPGPPELDVSAVHTARSRANFVDIQTNGAAAIDVEYVEPKPVRGLPSLDLCPD